MAWKAPYTSTYPDLAPTFTIFNSYNNYLHILSVDDTCLCKIIIYVYWKTLVYNWLSSKSMCVCVYIYMHVCVSVCMYNQHILIEWRWYCKCHVYKILSISIQTMFMPYMLTGDCLFPYHEWVGVNEFWVGNVSIGSSGTPDLPPPYDAWTDIFTVDLENVFHLYMVREVTISV